MKNIIKLGMLAALASASVTATTVTFYQDTATAVPSTTTSLTEDGGSTITVTPWRWDESGSAWLTTAKITRNSNGIGVRTVGTNVAAEGTHLEYLVFDFGGTATGNVQINSLDLYFANVPSGPFFKYAWLSASPSGGTPDAGLDPWGIGGGTSGAFTNVYTSATSTNSGVYSFTTAISGSGRYLMLGAINGTLNSTNYFQVKSIDYTSVPDGASTLALMGAALATLGFAGRRRKA